ncbi:MAG: hypothetical protein ACLGHL_05685, partial [Actinomycetota bacterium]
MEIEVRRTAAVASLLILGACGGDAPGSEAFCEATREVVNMGEVSEMPAEVDTMVEEAPDEIKDEAEAVREGFVE